jgi:hypothetical protein
MTTFVTDLTREFIASESDFDRSATAGGTVVILLIALLIERELIGRDGRHETRSLTAFSIPLLSIFVVLVIVRLEILLR